MRAKKFARLIGVAAAGWNNDNALRLSAALAYYSIFSLAPLLILVIAAAGSLYGEAAARGHVADQVRELAGSRAADAIQAMLVSTGRKSASVPATVIGLGVLMFGASGVFTELKDALNTIWGVRVKPGRALLRMARERVISFIMVLGVGFLLLLSLVVSATLTALDKSVDVLRRLPGPVWQGADIVLSLGIVTLLFGMIYKGLPNVRLRWRDVWTGAGCTAFLFTVGKFVIGVYLGTTGVASYYGAAGSAVVILLWVYYSACIVFYGAEFTKAYVVRDGRAVEPDERAVMRGGESLKK